MVPLPGRAADAVTDAIQAAYAPYRAALFRTNSKAQAESEQAIAAARGQWRTLAERHGTRPGAPYDRDAAFAATLKQVDEVYARAEAQIGARQLPEAHETLEKARDLLSELRRRNNVVVFSDHMNAYHEQMEHVLIDGAKALAQPGGLLEVAALAGTLDYLARRLRSEAPAALAQDGEFKPLSDAVLASVGALRSAIARQDEAAVREAIGKLKAPYSRLFLKFG
ncbi:MAG: hypothetical protein HZC37_22025 [Burkholderiales bacterium]|nr:hypothetical protein [Burkholderiales bacterium]